MVSKKSLSKSKPKKPAPRSGAKSQLKYEPDFSEKISRLFIFRALWIIAIAIPVCLWGIWIGVVTFLQFWHMLILGRRHKALWKMNLRFVRYVERWNAYFHFIVDGHPNVLD